jgi:hypothetical protein
MIKERQKRIGLFIGREWSWPAAFISEVNGRNNHISADFVQIGDTKWDSKSDYDVIIDRMSQEIPYYRSFLKSAILSGCYVINDPFIGAIDDKYFGLTLANHLGINTPCTVALPNKRVETKNVPESFRNLTYPLDWNEILEYVGTPAVLEDIKTGGQKFRQQINTANELIEVYDQSDVFTVALTKSIEPDEIIRGIVIGQQDVLLVRFDPQTNLCDSQPLNLDSPIHKEVAKLSLLLTRTYGYDINEVEFAVINDNPVIISPSNTAPDFDINVLSPKNFRWCVEKAADFAIKMAIDPKQSTAGRKWIRPRDDA